MARPLLEIRNLTVSFATRHGAFTAVDGFDLTLERNEVLAIVGESGSGKSVAMLAAMGLLPPTATVSADRMAFDGADLLSMTASERRRIAGKDMAMIFQEPMSSLNPCFTVGFQIGEVARRRTSSLKRAERDRRVVELLAEVGIPDPERRAPRLSPPALRRHEPARHDRDGARLPAETPDRGRADDRARCHHPGANPRSSDAGAPRQRHGARAHHPRHGRGRRNRRPRHRPICRPADGDERRARAVRRSASSLYRSASGGVAGAGERAAPARHSGRRARAVRPPARLRVLAPLRLCFRRLPRVRAAAG